MKRLVEFKYKLSDYKNEKMELNYIDYEIEVIPIKLEEWKANEKEFQVIRRWKYKPDTDLITTVSETVEIRLDNSMISEFYYGGKEDLFLGGIDKLYKKALENGEDIDGLLEEYFESFKESVDKIVNN